MLTLVQVKLGVLNQYRFNFNLSSLDFIEILFCIFTLIYVI